MQCENIALYAFRKFGDTALQAAFCCLGNRADAEDVAQEIFFALHRNPREFQDDEHLKAYILRSVINRCKNLRGSIWHRMRVSFEEAVLPQQAGPDESGLQEIIRMIRALPPPYNAVLYLHDYEGYTIREIAEMLGRSENTVSTQLRRGHRKLQAELTDSGVIHELL
ncbi:MAG: RNA polymerase sigma factor [Oscillospiraceae bacterium]|nr:RNA polymerase sigma factor [Oscillospiraceae bacterium]MCR4759874.1 RNA polymerase sigma factor [Oscillospiraceae bacterium]